MAGRTIRPRLRSRLSAIITLRAQIMRDSRFTAYVYGAIYTVERKCGGFNGFGISYTPLDGCIHVRGLVACYDVVDEFSRRLCCKALILERRGNDKAHWPLVFHVIKHYG